MKTLKTAQQPDKLSKSYKYSDFKKPSIIEDISLQLAESIQIFYQKKTTSKL